MIDAIIDFLDTYYIDTDYYLNPYARDLVDSNTLTLLEIDKLPSDELIDYLDIDKLIKEENIVDFLQK